MAAGASQAGDSVAVVSSGQQDLNQDDPADPISGPTDGTEDISARLAAIRRRFLISVSTVMMALAVIGLPISLSRIPKVGFNLNHIIHIIISVLIGLVFFTRDRLRSRQLAHITLFIFSVLSLGAFWRYGIVSAGFFLAAAGIFVAGATFGLRGGVVCAGLNLVMITVFAFLWLTGRLVFPIDVREYIMLPSVWILLMVSFIITTAIYFLSATSVIRELRELIAAVESQKGELERRSEELSQNNRELQAALDKVEVLSGLLPICARCKKIRDDSGYWKQVEEYFEEHSRAEFTHSICPDCLREMYPEIADRLNED